MIGGQAAILVAMARKVFISSVSQGMELYREAVSKAIEGLDGYSCVKMESFGARDAPSDDVCLKQVRESDVFVGILGHQYGTVHPSGKSYSEREYDAAVEAGIERLMFVAPDDFPVQAHLIESDAKREAQRGFRERVKQDRQVAFFRTHDELASKVDQAIFNSKAAQESQAEVHKVAETHHSRTWLLFPFVTNESGVETGISISNVSLDPLGTTPESGRVTLYFYGDKALDPAPISIVGPGKTFASTLSSIIRPNFFQGYIVASCGFKPARGFAFISGTHAETFGPGYLAEVLRVEG
jgi:hypothetical protein